MKKLLRALILEDNENDALLLQRELRRGGFELDALVVDNAADLRTALSDRKWDIILSDYSMHGFNAPAALRIVQERGLDIPVIIVSGTIGEDTAVHAMKAGATDFFTKDKLIRLVPAVDREVRDARERYKRREAEAELHSSEERYQTLFNLSLNAIYIHDLEGNFIDANPAALRLLGYDRKDLDGLNFQAIVLPDYIDESMETLKKTVELGYQYRAAEFRLRRKDGHIIDVETMASVIYRNNQPRAIQGIARDITHRKRAHAEEYARRLFAEALHDTTSALLSSKLDVNTMLARILEYAASLIPCDAATLMLVEAGMVKVVHCRGFDQQAATRVLDIGLKISDALHLQTMAESKRPLVIADTTAYTGWRKNLLPEMAITRSYLGSPIFVGDKLFGFINLDSQTVDHFTPEHADRLKILTDQAAVAIHNAELYEQLYQSERLARSTVDALSAHVAILDDTGQIISVNQAWRDFAWENTYSEVIRTFEGENYLTVCDKATGEGGEDAALVAAAIRAVIAGEQDTFDLEYACHAPDEALWFIVRITRFRGAGPVRVVVAHENITERKQAEISRARYAERLELLHNIDRAILRGEQTQTIAYAAISRLQELIECHSLSVTTFDLAHNRYTILTTTAPMPSELTPGKQHAIENMSIIRTLKRNEVFAVDDLREIPEPSATDIAMLRAGLHGYVCVPLISGDRLVGSINFRSESPGSIPSNKLEIAQEVAAQLAIAIEKARLLEIEQRRNSELTALHQASLQLTSVLDVESILDTILDYAILLVRADNAHIFLYQDNTLTFGAAQWAGKKQSAPFAEPRPDGTTYTVARSGQRLIIPDISASSDYYEVAWHGALISLPLQFADDTKGVMNLAFTEVHHLDEHEIRVLELLADQAAIAIHNAQLYGKIQQHADELEARVEKRTRQLQAAKDRVEAILNNTSDSIVLADENGLIEQANIGFDSQFGYQPDELFRHPLMTLAAPENGVQVNEALKEVIATRSNKRLEFAARRKDHSTFPVDGLISWFNGDGGGIVCSLRDMTSQKQVEDELREALEKEKELNELKTKFTSIVSHEFRTPLAVILSSAGLLLRYSDQLAPKRRQSKLETISHQVGRLTRLIDDVLTISRSENFGFEFKPAPIDLITLCNNIIEEIQVTYTNNVAIDFAHRGGCQPVLVDEYLFTHILQNLASNAVKYSVDGGTVKIWLHCGQNTVTVRVEDNGIGIPHDHLSRLFESFQRASNVGQIQGTGIGLTIVKRAVDAHGGYIEFESVEGAGTTFTIKLPIPDLSKSV
ncbi:MAG: PAS domain S-box protein [Chloroflexota bacterium]